MSAKTRDDLAQMGLDEYYDFERVNEAETLAAISSHAEKLAAAAQSAPKPEKHPQWGEPQWKRFFGNIRFGRHCPTNRPPC